MTSRSTELGRLVLVDGTFELFRAFYGAPSRRTAAGREIGATVSLVRNMLRLRRAAEVTHMALSFDTQIESFRNDLFERYKTGEGIDEELFAQFPLVEDVCEALGFHVLRMVEFEADDGLASLAARFEREPALERIIIASPDKDLTQCVVGDRIVTWDRLRQRHDDEEGVMVRMGVRPAQVPDYLALVGDPADGIPGIPRWGAKSTAQVLAIYDHLQDIPRSADDWSVAVRGKRALAENLARLHEEAELYRTLATLRRDVPVTEKLADLEPRPTDRATLERVAENYTAPELLFLFGEG